MKRAGKVAAVAAMWVAVITGSTFVVTISSLIVSGPAGAATARCSGNQVEAGTGVCVTNGNRVVLEVVDEVRALQAQYSLKAVIFGVWQGIRPLVSGALGTSYPGVPANRRMHFRIGNTTETFETTLLLQLVDRGKIRLSDPVSKWFPSLPNASKVTVGMLASSTSGYASFYTNQWTAEFDADPFRAWTPEELISIGTSQPLDFAPGTSWTFSDTNFVILGQILAKAGGAPVPVQIQRGILHPLHLDDTQMTPSSYIPSPVLHAYDSERGDYQDSTFWSISWAPNNGDMTSDLADLGVWARALGTGSLLSASSHARQFAPATVGLGPLTHGFYYGLGAVVSNGWYLAEPGLIGYTGLVSYQPQKHISVVIFATANPNAPAGGQYACGIFNRVGALLDPGAPPNIPTQVTHLPA